jgi:hypothetical protein
VISKVVLSRIKNQEKHFGFEPEITAKLAALGCRIFEVGVSYSRRSYQIEEHKAVYDPRRVSTLLQGASFSEDKIKYGYFEVFMIIWVTATK